MVSSIRPADLTASYLAGQLNKLKATVIQLETSEKHAVMHNAVGVDAGNLILLDQNAPDPFTADDVVCPIPPSTLRALAERLRLQLFNILLGGVGFERHIPHNIVK